MNRKSKIFFSIFVILISLSLVFDFFLQTKGKISLGFLTLTILIAIIYFSIQYFNNRDNYKAGENNPYMIFNGMLISILVVVAPTLYQALQAEVVVSPTFKFEKNVGDWAVIELDSIKFDSQTEWVEHSGSHDSSQEIPISISPNGDKHGLSEKYDLEKIWTRIIPTMDKIEIKTYLHPESISLDFDDIDKHESLLKLSDIDETLIFTELMKTGFINIKGLVDTAGNEEFFIRNPNSIDDFPFSVGIERITVIGDDVTTVINLDPKNGGIPIQRSISQWNGLIIQDIDNNDFFLIKVKTVFGKERAEIQRENYKIWGIKNFTNSQQQLEINDYLQNKERAQKDGTEFITKKYWEYDVLNNVTLSIIRVDIKNTK